MSLAVGHGQDVVTNKPEAKPSVPAILPGNGLAQHDFFYAGETKTRDMDMGKLVEYDEDGKAIWSAPAPRVWAATRLKNGNTLINDWANQWNGTIDPATAPVQAIEVTPDKKIVWALRSWINPVLGSSTTIQLLDEPDVPEAVHFGNIKWLCHTRLSWHDIPIKSR